MRSNYAVKLLLTLANISATIYDHKEVTMKTQLSVTVK